MLVAFELSMPTIGSWNGRWTGEGRLYVRVREIGKHHPLEAQIIGNKFHYRWDDGWSACVSVERVDSKTAAKLRKNTCGFYGYDWMIDSILRNGKILAED
jgi:hypothetical protein